VVEADLAAGGQGAVGLAGLVGQQPIAFGGLKLQRARFELDV